MWPAGAVATAVAAIPRLERKTKVLRRSRGGRYGVKPVFWCFRRKPISKLVQGMLSKVTEAIRRKRMKMKTVSALS